MISAAFWQLCVAKQNGLPPAGLLLNAVIRYGSALMIVALRALYAGAVPPKAAIRPPDEA